MLTRIEPPRGAATWTSFPRRITRLRSIMLAPLVAGIPALAAEAYPEGSDAEILPSVVTPTRLRQPLRDVPASVTVITAEMLARMGIVNVPDALRLVPGMQVTESSGNGILINYHGTNNRLPRRLNVLVDGMSVYRPGLSQIQWAQLPVSIDDIERIEVTRGPSSPAYGPNSMMAVVNIITKHPADVERASMTAGAGDHGVRRIHTRVAGNFGRTSMHLAASAESTHGFDAFTDQAQGHDTTSAKRLLARSHTTIDERTRLEGEMAYVEGSNESPFKGDFEDYADMRLRDFYVGSTLTTRLSSLHELQLRASYSDHQTRQEWVACFPQAAYLPEMFSLWQANPSYANAIASGQIPSGGTSADDVLAARAIVAIRGLGSAAFQPLCAMANQNLNESRFDVELQDTYVTSEQLRFVTGVGLRHQRAQSQTFLGGAASNSLYRVFGNVEYKPSRLLTLNVGAHAEHDPIVGWSLAPRGGANLHISPNQTVRVAVSRGLRTPDLAEQHANFTYAGPVVSPGFDSNRMVRFFQSAKSPGNMRNEELISTEVGYLATAPAWGLSVDMKIFEDRLRHLISEVVTVAGFTPTNNNSTTLRGAELQASASWSPDWSGFLNYAYLDNLDSTTFWERTQYSRHSGSVGVAHSIGSGWRWSLAYYGASGNGEGESRYGRTDLTIGRRFLSACCNAEFGLTLRRLDNTVTTYILSGPTLESSLDSRFQTLAWLRASF